MSNVGVLGAMFLQNFVALFTQDYSGVDNTNMLQLMVSETFALNGAVIS